MIISRQIRYLALAALISVTPVYPMGGFFSFCKDCFYDLPKEIITKTIKGEATVREKMMSLCYLAVCSYWAYLLIFATIKARDTAFLKKHNIDIDNIKSKHLIGAIEEENIPLIRTLLRYEVETPYNFSESPLAFAIKKNPILVELILKNSKSLDQWVIKNAIEFAIEKGQTNVNAQNSIEILVRYCENLFPSLMDAARNNSKAFEVIVEHGKRTRKIDKYFDEIIYEIVDRNYRLNASLCQSIKILQKHGANINARYLCDSPSVTSHCIYKTALTRAISETKPAMVKFLLKQGADLMVPGTQASAYDYNNDSGWSRDREARAQIANILDNHRRKLAKKYTQEVFPKIKTEVNTHLTKDPANIATGYIEEEYPLMEERPLASLEPVGDGLGLEIDVD